VRRRDVLARAGRVGEGIVAARLAWYAGLAWAVTLGAIAAFVLVVLALTGAGPGAGASLVAVLACAVLGGAIARALVRRVSLISVAAFALRRLRRRGRARRGAPPPGRRRG
jgi:hypothetical protein